MSFLSAQERFFFMFLHVGATLNALSETSQWNWLQQTWQHHIVKQSKKTPFYSMYVLTQLDLTLHNTSRVAPTLGAQFNMRVRMRVHCPPFLWLTRASTTPWSFLSCCSSFSTSWNFSSNHYEKNKSSQIPQPTRTKFGNGQAI